MTTAAMRNHRNHIDLVVLIAVLLLMVLSLGVVYSASSAWALQRHGESEFFLGRHATKVVIGFLAILAVMHIDYHHYRRLTKPVLITAVGLLVITLVASGAVKGATRWLQIGGISFQPSELAKYALVFHLAALMAVKGERLRDFRQGFLPAMVWIVLVTLLIFLQPNFSTGAMLVAVSIVMLFLGRARMRHLALAGAAVVPFAVLFLLSADYRLRRVLAFLQGEGGDANAQYQVLQGIIGFGNGGLLGLGPGGSRQREMFLPESYGDFVYAIIGEEYGLIGTVLVLALFVLILVRGIRIARHAPDTFGMYLAAGITITITFYAVVNAGVTLGLLPTTGLPMPLVSYGGSSMLFTAFAAGVLLNISTQTDLHPRLTPSQEGVRPMEPVKPAVGKIY
jgi:cell division protein FtsW